MNKKNDLTEFSQELMRQFSSQAEKMESSSNISTNEKEQFALKVSSRIFTIVMQLTYEVYIEFLTKKMVDEFNSITDINIDNGGSYERKR